MRPALQAFAFASLVVLALAWPLPLHLGQWHMLTAWGDSHIWVMEWTLRHLLALDPGGLVRPTDDAGYPVPRDLRSVGGAALLLYAPLRLLLDPLAAGTLTHLFVLPASATITALAMGALLPDSRPALRAPLAVAYALGPTVLSTLGMGEISNTQAWVLPAFLWACQAAFPFGGPDRPARAPWIALVALLGGLSSPYLGLALPLLGLGWALLRRRLGGAALLLLCLLIGLLPVRAWFGGAGSGKDSLVAPAPRAQQGPPAGRALPHPPPVATPDSLLFGLTPPPRSPYEPTHISYLGLPLLLAALILGRRQRLGLVLFSGGVTLALGPWLAVDGRYPSLAGHALPLPVAALEALGYPTRQGGLYFRYAILAELGLALMLLGGLSSRPSWKPGRALALAWALAILHIADSVRATMPRWPLRSEPVAGLDALREMGRVPLDPQRPAVLELPLQGPTDGHFGQAGVLRALFHRRKTSSLLRDVRPHEDRAREVMNEARRQPERAAAVLMEAGFGWVVLPDELARFSQPDPRVLRALLGEPWSEAQGLRVWRLSAAQPQELGEEADRPDQAQVQEHQRPEGPRP